LADLKRLGVLSSATGGPAAVSRSAQIQTRFCKSYWTHFESVDLQTRGYSVAFAFEATEPESSAIAESPSGAEPERSARSDASAPGSPGWLSLQSHHDTHVARKSLGNRLDKIRRCAAWLDHYQLRESAPRLSDSDNNFRPRVDNVLRRHGCRNLGACRRRHQHVHRILLSGAAIDLLRTTPKFDNTDLVFSSPQPCTAGVRPLRTGRRRRPRTPMNYLRCARTCDFRGRRLGLPARRPV
jgi:hypothetical protein